jgi:hypothetical protein
VASGELWRTVKDGHEDELQELLDEGYSNAQIMKALMNYHNYDVEFDQSFDDTMVWTIAFGEVEEQTSLDYIVEIFAEQKLRAPFLDEIDLACEGIDEMLGSRGHRSRNADELYQLLHGKTKYLEVTFHVSIDGGLGAVPNWDNIREDLGDEPEEAGKPDERTFEERIIHRYANGSYVLDLKPEELDEEGRVLGMCVGRADMPYKRLVQRGQIAIWSIRTQAGRPKFTIEVELNEKGEPTGFAQVKGKANRQPGFDLGLTHPGSDATLRNFKPSEVELIVELCEAVGITPSTVSDLKPAMLFYKKGLKQNPGHGSPEHCSWCARAAKLERKYGGVRPWRARGDSDATSAATRSRTPRRRRRGATRNSCGGKSSSARWGSTSVASATAGTSGTTAR